MYELEVLDSSLTERLQQQGGSIREALEDGRLEAVPLALPKPERRKQDATLKIMATALIVSLIAMSCYAAWRVRDIERLSEESDYDYCLIGTEDFNDDNKVDSTCDRDFKPAG